MREREMDERERWVIEREMGERERWVIDRERERKREMDERV